MRGDVQVAARPAYAHDTISQIARTRGGVVFDPRQDRWAYREGVKTISLDFASIPALSPRMKSSLKRALLWYAENSSPSHLQNMHSHFLRLAQCLASNKDRLIEEISDVDVLNYKDSLPAERTWYLGALSGFLKKWHQLGFPGVSGSAAGLLSELRLKGNPHGIAVLTMDPVVGPFTPIEQEALQAFVNEAFAQGILDEEVYFLAWLFMALGARPAQYAALKVCDLRKDATSSGGVTFTLKVPRVKQRNEGPRDLFKDRTLVPQIGAPLYEYAQRVRSTFEGLLDNPDQAPLFPAMRQGGRVASTPEYAYHDTSKGLSFRLIQALNALEIPSERTGASLNITPVRFRRTLGTRAAQEGYGELIIAELLDHTDTQHVGVYVGSIPEIAERIDRAVAMALAPLAQAFAGVIISDESEATRAGDPTSRIVDYRTDQSKPMGSCGQYSFCSFSAPIACYTCANFEPWLDGPHEALLVRLLAERERLASTTDKRIVAINDRTILAVAQVIQMCEMIKLEEGANRG
jgi:integrase